MLVRDGADIERFLADLEGRCWLAGLGWIALSAAGSYLVRSIIDVTVGAPERLCFEAPAIIEAPLAQDPVARRPVVHPGDAIDSFAVCPPLTSFERAEVRRLQDNGRRALADERNRILVARAGKLATQRGITVDAARRIVDDQCRGILASELVLEFDDPEIARTTTVADLLDDPAKYEGQTLADPNEGISYGPGKGKVMIDGEGTPWIHSFAHGRTIYQLRYSAAAVRERIERETGDVVAVFISLVLRAKLDRIERDDLIDLVAGRARRKVTQIRGAVEAALKERAQRRREEERERRRAERNDRRPILPQPSPMAPLTEEMAKINGVIGDAPLEQQPRRDLEGHVVKTRWQTIPGTHAFGGGEEEDKTPERWTIARLNEYGLTEEIEKFINYVDGDGEPVRPPMPFVRAYMTRDDRVLATLAAIATEPIVLADGEVLGRENGFDRTRGIQFIIPDEVLAAVPRREDLTDAAIATAMNFLIDEWLVDVEADFEAKCSIVASAATMIERSVLPVRPVFFFTAGRAGGGKTTTIYMIILAVTGNVPAAQAWTGDENERRKALHSHLMAGAAYIVWDNIPRGERITCPHIERSCTTAYYIDRKLGVSETVMASAATIHFFTGNNIEARGDLSSRAINIRVKTERPDPEDRDYKHPDPFAWTTANRGAILRALYTVLLGNPTLKKARDAMMKTRFKTWYRIIGSAVEHAAKLAEDARIEKLTEVERAASPARVVDFQKLLRKNKGEDDEDDASLAEVLALLDAWAMSWAMGTVAAVNARAEAARNGLPPPPPPEGPLLFKAARLCDLLNKQQDIMGSDVPLREACRAFLYPELQHTDRVNARSLGHRLKRHVDETVSYGKRTLVLRTGPEPNAGTSYPVAVFWIEARAVEGAATEGTEEHVNSEVSESLRPSATEEIPF